MTNDNEVLSFLENAVTALHATAEIKKKLLKSHFIELNEKEIWKLEAGKKYFVTRMGSSIIAFKLAKSKLKAGSAWRMIGAHTDSPCLKIRPLGEQQKFNYCQLGVEIYGSPILSTWFDRDLSLAGRTTYLDSKNEMRSSLVNFKEAIATIPNLAIHLNRDVNQNRSINPQLEIVPLLGQTLGKWDLLQLLRKNLEAESEDKVKEILSFDLSFYDTQRPQWVGLEKEFLSSARLDNLLSCYIAAYAITHSQDDYNQLVICSDHEEVGSASAQGASGTFLKDVLLRIMPDVEERVCSLQKSLLISADNAHGVHPNYSEKHDYKHAPILNSGPVLKVNANQRYATNDLTQASLILLCKKRKIPYQHFIARSDMGCGSTIGPITAAELGIPTIDIGLPTFAMHSIRELAGRKDIEWGKDLGLSFLEEENLF